MSGLIWIKKVIGSVECELFCACVKRNVEIMSVFGSGVIENDEPVYMW